MANSNQGLFNWGIIGTGVVARKFTAGLRQSRGSSVGLVCGRDLTRTQAFAKDFGIPNATDSVSQAAANPKIDAFYIATPPTTHLAQALTIIAAGKPVLIEKPIAASAADAQAIVAAAREAHVFAMEGIWTCFLPLLGKLRTLIANGTIGEIRSIEASFGISNRAELSDNQFNPALGGGALFHRGLYPLALALDLVGPGHLESSAATIGDTGVDEDAVLLFRHENGALSTLRSSLRAPLSNDMVISGTRGRLHIHTPLFRPFSARLTRVVPVHRTGNRKPRFESLRESNMAQRAMQLLARFRWHGALITSHYRGNGYHYEADAVIHAIRTGATESPIMPLARTLAIAETIEAARGKWTTR